MGRKYFIDPDSGERIYIRNTVPSLGQYRKKADQDAIDNTKVDKVGGKDLSTNDYDNAAKAKVDAIPSNPKYTDTVYDDTDVKADLNSCVKFVTQSLTDAQKAQVKTNIDATRITKTWITRSWTLSTFNTYATFGRSESWTAPTSGIVVGDIFTIKVDINDCSNLRGYILVQVTDIKYDVSSLVGTTLFACTQYAEKETLTELEKTSARSRLGAASSSDVEAISSNYISVDDESDVETVHEDVHDVRVNGTSIVENGVANLKEASGDDYGVVKLNSAYGISVYNHFLSTNPAVNSIIDAKTNSNRPITPYYLDYAVKSGLADSKIEWTDADKKSACERIGAVRDLEMCLIESITIEEDCEFSINAEPNGEPYKFESLFVRITNDTSKQESWKGIAISASSSSSISTYRIHWSYLPSTSNIIEIFVRKESGVWITENRSVNSEFYSSSPSFSTHCVVSDENDLIRRLTFSKIIAGTTIEIYAIRA